MSLWVKICGNTSLEDAQLAAEAGADAVGFVFAPGPRQVTAEQVSTIIPNLPDDLEKVGVFVESSFEEIARAVDVCGLTGVQLHWHGTDDLPARLRERFGQQLRILSVLHYGPDVIERAGVLAGNSEIDAILVDSRTATAVGGTGIRFDWIAAETLFRNAQIRLIVAGGLSPWNVQEAIGRLRPWGVDVVSGVEMAPGRKDPTKVRTFVTNARGASRS